MKLPIIQNRKIYFIFSSTLIIITLLSLIAWGLKPGIDFTGGSLAELKFKERPSAVEVQESLQDFNLGEINIQPAGEDRMILRFKDIDEETHSQVLSKLKEDFGSNKEKGTDSEQVDDQDEASAEDESTSEKATADKKETKPEVVILDESDKLSNISISASTEDGTVVIGQQGEEEVWVEELRFDSIGPSIGQELRAKAYKTILYVIIAIIFYVAWAFRKVAKPVNSWKYGVIAVIALLHDVLITIGVFVFLGRFLGVEINTPFIAALLTILGYSVNDTIVVFDRVRENLHRYHENFEETVNDSVNETITRSINTSTTTLLVLLAVYFFGGETIRNFILALIVGMAAGTYSSIFIGRR